MLPLPEGDRELKSFNDVKDKMSLHITESFYYLNLHSTSGPGRGDIPVIVFSNSCMTRI